ncbi:Oidioi.mRNA.OKI2018_I69.PAR.g13169.t1.cds [Oikopleura dioica]|uniref:Oidioi.mRNA.OKI2018_I69.PAR.g13169.t1.cds n=1 Tax=Oikopleura dioica TaxID=34765 RepID=A0ABN7S3E8_OIKDI|nr:Oidioi.mRNA.OKI2018_I69.PAR.g13169.t1.cds [Oikopleura dioica]
MFSVQQALEKISNDRELKRSHNAELKKETSSALLRLKDPDQNPEKEDLQQKSSRHAEIAIRTLELGCKSKSPSIQIVAIDTLCKVLAHAQYLGNTPDPDEENPNRLAIDRVLLSVADAFQGVNTDENVQLQIIKALLTAVSSNHIAVHETTLLNSVRTIYNIHLASKSLVNQTTARATLTQILSLVFSRMETAALEEIEYIQEEEKLLENSSDDSSESIAKYALDLAILRATRKKTNLAVLQKDAFLVFRSLCKLSMKPLADGPPDPRSPELRSKVLSLQLILSVLQNAGPEFRRNATFSNAIKQYLCVALSKNGVSTVPEVFELSLAIFLSLLSGFKTHLKAQIEVFFKEIFLSIIESPSSTFVHRALVLEALARICADSQSVVDLYVNYDCDINAANIFERLVGNLARLVQTKTRKAEDFEEESIIRMKALDCLVNILKCMAEWSRDLYINPHSEMSIMGKEFRSASEVDTLEVDTNGVTSTSDNSDSGYKQGESQMIEQLERLKSHKAKLEAAIALFNKKPKKGLKAFIELDVTKDDPKEIGKFLLREERLSPDAIGELLGEGDQYNINIMHAYVDLLDFSQLGFVAAIRKFLSGFRLPGEAQKIDRLMEKLAARYVQCNPENATFASADAAYVLAYSIIMLTTDLHSAQVKKKMTVEDYIKMNRGINNDSDLPPDYLTAIYNEIKEEPISLKKQQHHAPENATMTDKLRKKIYESEMESIATTAKALMEAVSHVTATFVSTSHSEHVRPMFKMVWRPALAAFSFLLQYQSQKEIVSLVLDGVRCAIRLSGIFRLDLERDSFIGILSRFSLLQQTSGVQEMQTKNIDAIKTLIMVAYTDGNYLGTTWAEVLRCISQLEFLQHIGTGVKEAGGDKSHDLQRSLAETSIQSVVVAVDKIFAESCKLNGEAIVDFTRALCQVSADELKQSPPRMYSLTKLVEISYYNMGRIRLQWSRVWSVLGEHFTKTGCSEDESIAAFALDSLRQLSIKYLEKGELPNYKFQNDFLRPFETIMKRTTSLANQDLVLRCIAQLVDSNQHNIRSGWKNVFGVLGIAAGSDREAIVELAFTTTTLIANQTVVRNWGILAPYLQDCVKCLSEFACNPQFPDTSMEAIRLIRVVADHIAANQKAFESLSGDDISNIPLGDRVWLRGWFPLMFELSAVISRCKLDVRTRALTVMFELIKSHGGNFKPNWWEDLFNVLFRVFDGLKLPEAVERREWMDTTCHHALFAVCDVFSYYYSTLAPLLLKDMHNHLVWCIKQKSPQLAQGSCNCLENLVLANQAVFDEAEWKEFLNCFRRIKSESDLSGQPEIQRMVEKELVHAIEAVLNTTKKAKRSPSETDEKLESLSAPGWVLFELCELLGDIGAKARAPHTSQQACIRQLQLLFQLVSYDEFAERVHNQLKESCSFALKSVLQNATYHSWQLTQEVINGVLSLNSQKFAIHAATIHKLLCDLLIIECPVEVRQLMSKYFMRAGMLAGLTQTS